MKTTIKQIGRIVFDPKDETNKHASQSNWKRTAMVLIEGDITSYYSWFIEKRYGLVLNKPLRNAHITFINDRTSDMNDKWDEIKTKWNGKTIEVVINVEPRTDSDDKNSTCHWWLNIPEEDRVELHNIRQELGLGRPHWGLHLSLGYANEKNEEHSKYIHRLIKKGIIK
jgi:hypothetical protein